MNAQRRLRIPVQDLIDGFLDLTLFGIGELVCLLVSLLPNRGAQVALEKTFQNTPMRLIFGFQPGNSLHQFYEFSDLAGVELCGWHSSNLRWAKAIIGETRAPSQATVRWQPLALADALDIAGAA